jgi:hypothetical protein
MEEIVTLQGTSIERGITILCQLISIIMDMEHLMRMDKLEIIISIIIFKGTKPVKFMKVKKLMLQRG